MTEFSEIGAVRNADDGSIEILICIEYVGGDRTETWDPLVEVVIQMTPLEFPTGRVYPITIRDALIQSGWLPPDEPLAPFLCDLMCEYPPHEGVRCTQRRGHSGWHASAHGSWLGRS